MNCGNFLFPKIASRKKRDPLFNASLSPVDLLTREVTGRVHDEHYRSHSNGGPSRASIRTSAFVILGSLFLCTTMYSQQPPKLPPRDPQALALAAQAEVALQGASVLRDIKVTGSTLWGSAQQATGPIILEASGTDFSRFEVSSASITEVRNSASDPPLGSWRGSDGIVHEMASHNCWIPAGWFLPYGFITSMLESATEVSYVARETEGERSVDHLRYSHSHPAKTPALVAMSTRLATVDVFLDVNTHLPLYVTFSIHPDQDANSDIPTKIVFSDYRQVHGIEVPFKISQFVQNTVRFDATLESADVNSGLPETEFSLQ